MSDKIVITVELTEDERTRVLMALGAWLALTRESNDPKRHAEIVRRNLATANKFGCLYNLSE